MKRRLFVTFAALFLMLVLAVTASAATEIDTAAELAALMGTTDSAKLSGSYILTADIDLSSVSNQKPIGSKDYPFTGTFDGDGHTVKGINIVDTAGYCGFFGRVSGATIKNLTVRGSIDSNKYFVGGLVGVIGDAKATTLIENCVNYCTVKQHTNTATAVAGGIVGMIRAEGINGMQVTIKNCVNYGTVSASKQAAGIVSRVKESSTTQNSVYTIIGCENYGTATVRSGDDTASGILGCALLYGCNLTVQNCYNDADATITGGYRVGGIAGVLYLYTASAKATIDTCVNQASVTAQLTSASANAGGILGCVGTSAETSLGTATVKNCFNGGDVSITASRAANAGRILGTTASNSAVTFTGNCYDANATLPSGANTLGGATQVTDLSDASQYPSTFSGVFIIGAGGPVPKNAPHDCEILLSVGKCVCALCGEELLDVENGVILLQSAEDVLLLMANGQNDSALGYSYKLTADVNLNSVDGQSPIGTRAHAFTGTFDGNGKKVSGIKLSLAGESTGFFGHASGATIQNLTVAGEISATGMITTDSSKLGTGIGGIVGTIGGEANKTTKVIGCVNYCALSSTSNPSRIGGIVGVVQRQGKANIHVVIEDCVNYADIECKKHAGGILGRIEDYSDTATGGTTKILNCVNYGDIVGATGNYDGFGGMLGCVLARNTVTTIEKCVNLGDMSGGYRVGGIVGITYMYTAGSSLTVNACANLGNHSAFYSNTTHSVGGIIGTGAGSADTAKGLVTVKNSFNGGNVSAISAYKAQGGMIVGLILSGLESAVDCDENNFYATTATLNAGGNTTGAEEIVAAKWCMEYGFTFTDAVEPTRDHFWSDASENATCEICGVTRHAKHAGTMKSVSEEATCSSYGYSYDLCETCYLRENVVLGTEYDADNHAIAWNLEGATAALKCAYCDHTEDLTNVNAIYVSDDGDDDNLGLSADAPLKSYTDAFDVAAKMGKDVTLYLVGDTVTVSGRNYSAENTSAKSFEESPHAYTVTVTSANASDKTTFVVPNTVTYYYLYGPTTFENIKITGTTAGTLSGGGSIRFYGRGFAITMGEGIEMVDIDGKISETQSNGTFGLSNTVTLSDAKVLVYGGFQSNGYYAGIDKTNMNTELTTNVTVLSGSYFAVVGGSYSGSISSIPIDFVDSTANITIGDIDVRYVVPFSLNETVSINDSTANVYVKGAVSAVYIYRFLYNNKGSGEGNTVNYYFYDECVGMKVGDYPMVSKTAGVTINSYYEPKAEADETAWMFQFKSIYYRESYPNLGEKSTVVEGCFANGGHNFENGACTVCGVAKCSGAAHYIAWDASGKGKCIAGCGATVANITSCSAIYVSDNGTDGADGKSAATAIRSYTLAQRLAAKANKTFTIYLVGTVTLDTNAVSQSNNFVRMFEEENHSKKITVTSATSSKATLLIPYHTRNYFLSGPVTFTKLKISGDRHNGLIRFFARGNNITMGSGLEMVNVSGGAALSASKTDAGISGFGASAEIPNSKVYVFGGFYLTDGKIGAQDGGDDPQSYTVDMSIQSGKYWAVCGGGYSDDTTNAPVVLDGANIRIGMSAFTARYLVPTSLNDINVTSNTTVKMEYKGKATVVNAYRFAYGASATGDGNVVNHFFYSGMKDSAYGDFGMGSYSNGVQVNCYYATAVSNNKLVKGFNTKSTKFAAAYGQTGDVMSFPEWCIEYGGGHTFTNGVCSFCGIVPCSTHDAVWEVLKEATCVETGLEAKRCVACFEHVEADREIAINPDAHDAAWVYGDTSAEYVCSLCGEVLDSANYADLAGSEIHVSAAASAGGDGTAASPVSDFGLAMQIAAQSSEDVTIYIHDIATIYDNGHDTSLLDYIEPVHTNRITITSYGDTQAVLRFETMTTRTMCYYLSGPTTFENLELSTWSNGKAMYIVARHNELTMGEGISIDYQRKGANEHGSAVYLVGGCYGTKNSVDITCGTQGANLTVLSGSYSTIYGGTYNGRCCDTDSTEPIYLNLLGDILTRNAIIAGSYGNATYDAYTGDIYITVDGNITTGTYFSFTSAGNDTSDADNPIPFTSENVTLKIYSGSINVESFGRSNKMLQSRAIGATTEGETAVDRLDSLSIYVDATSPSAVVAFNRLKTSLITPVTDMLADEGSGEEEEGEESGDAGEGDGEGEGAGDDFGAGTGETAIADPNKYTFYWMDADFCSANGGDHTPNGGALESVAASCTMEGYNKYLCSACGEEYVELIEKEAHVYDVTVPIAATCIAPAMEKQICSVCSAPKFVVTGSEFGAHTEPVGGFCQLCNADLSVDCAHDNASTEAVTVGCGTGTKWYCPDCDKTVVDIPGAEHNYGKYVVTVEPTETTAGIKTRTCKGCGKVDTALMYATDTVNASAVATDASGEFVYDVITSKLSKSEKAALNALLQESAYGAEVKVSYEIDGESISGVTYSIPVPAAYTDYTDVRVVIKDDDGKIHFVDFKIEKGYIVFTF